MSREILYRGKRTDNGEWAEGLPGYDINGHITEIEVFKGFGICYALEIDPETICEYTGLPDKNDRKIFKGDIVKHYNDDAHPERFDIGVILWDEKACTFCRSSNKNNDFCYIDGECVYEVIGNIFDNPELIE